MLKQPHGDTIISDLSNAVCFGQTVALITDKATCSKCKKGLVMAEKILLKREEQPLSMIKITNVPWAWDIMHDALYKGKRITVNVFAR